jgi:hypothetical protein
LPFPWLLAPGQVPLSHTGHRAEPLSSHLRC